MLRTVGRYLPPPAGVSSPLRWGTEEGLRELLGSGVAELRCSRQAFAFRYASPEDFADFFTTNYGPVHKAFQAQDQAGRRRFHDDLVALAREHDRGPGPSVAMPSEYLQAVAVRA
jgi:hypothetical protein